MQIEIKGKKYNCIFGVKFIRELDKQHGVVRNDEFVETVDDIEALFDETLKYLEESNAGKLTVRNFKKALMENK